MERIGGLEASFKSKKWPRGVYFCRTRQRPIQTSCPRTMCPPASPSVTERGSLDHRPADTALEWAPFPLFPLFPPQIYFARSLLRLERSDKESDVCKLRPMTRNARSISHTAPDAGRYDKNCRLGSASCLGKVSIVTARSIPFGMIFAYIPNVTSDAISSSS